MDWIQHGDLVLDEILGLCSLTVKYLTLPCVSRARHKITSVGRREAAETAFLASKLDEQIISRLVRLSALCEILKREGMPANEASRIRQWEQMIRERIQKLRMIKMYRTPQALRSFSRLFSLLLPPFYAPYYATLAHDLNSIGTAVAFSVFTSLALTSLFETVSQMEDPFVLTSVLDGVHVDKQLSTEFTFQLLALRQSVFPEASEYKDKPMRLALESVGSLMDATAPIRLVSE